MLLSLMNLATQHLSNEIPEEFVVICARYYVDASSRGYQDELLKNQKYLTNWIGLGALNLKSVLTPEWTSLGLLDGFRRTSVAEHQFVANRILEEEEERRIALKEYPYILNYLESVLKTTKTVDHTIAVYQHIRALAVTGTFFASIWELTLKLGAQPIVRMGILPNLEVNQTLEDGTPLEFSPPMVAPWIERYLYMQSLSREPLQELSQINFQQEFIQFLTTSSSGRESVPSDVFSHKTLSKALRKRVPAFAMESKDEIYDSEKKLTDAVKGDVQMGNRDQIGRRQRKIAGVNNIVTMLGFVAYKITDVMLKHVKAASSGSFCIEGMEAMDKERIRNAERASTTQFQLARRKRTQAKKNLEEAFQECHACDNSPDLNLEEDEEEDSVEEMWNVDSLFANEQNEEFEETIEEGEEGHGGSYAMIYKGFRGLSYDLGVHRRWNRTTSEETKEKIKMMESDLPGPSQPPETKKLIKKSRARGVYPYDYMTDASKFEITRLPSKEEFFNKLTNSHITDEQYVHAQNVWNVFKIRNMLDYHNLYMLMDTLLLADVWQHFRNMSMKNYEIDPGNMYSAPGLAWNDMLKMTGVRLGQLSN
ncbi:hypothetical protein GE061_007787 [Apolygus lucorum]|uniref:RNA-directed RNA polymerase N-terminal domain-containing protein n=1 Tax=Apolygus lucorum TaxID=248454 RepID=A0A8S9WPH7_APOLU|nr:hypothetical protein GE061_007787 [Apolygus lucorum]